MAHKLTPEYSFVSSWVDWLQKNTGYSRHEVSFSEGLLNILYYETDIGSIPRGAQPESYPTSKAKYKNNPNWSTHIMGCYWCSRDRTVVNGICCSKDCILYFHEWCIERVELFQGRRFCKRPGCDLSPTEANYVCCSRSHNREYEQMCEFISKKQLRDVLIKGPSWYNCEHSFDKTPVLTHNTSKPVAETAMRDLAKQMKSNLIHYIDIGPIPRSHKTAAHSASHFSKHKNWLADISGCYLCGMSVTDGCEYLCSNRCYIVFNEWCRRKLLTERGIKYCVFPGCSEVLEHQYFYCNQQHFDNRDKYLESKECCALLQRGPHWYNNTLSHTNIENTGQSNKHSTPDITGLNIQNTVNIPQHSKHMKKMKSVTNPVPCPIQSQHSAVPISKSLTTLSNQNEKIVKMKPYTKLPQSYTPDITGLNIQNTDNIPQHSQHMKRMKSVTNPVPCPIQSQHSAVPISKSLTTLSNQNENIVKMNPYSILPQSSRLTENLTTETVLPAVTSKIPKKFVVSEKNDQNKLSSYLALIAGPMKCIDSADTPTNPELFSQKLTSLLRQHTDIGVIPRVTDPICSETEVSGCYWCESSQTSYNVVTCSSRCWYLLHEWCVRKVEHVCKLCEVPGCEKTRIPGCNCCSIPHIKQLSKLRGDLIGTEEEVELILGPIWHEDMSPISFSSKQSPFYEFSNFYCCSIQVKNTWPTVYHYLCSQQLCGTPYYRHIPQIESIRELNTFMDSSCVAKWVRPDWNSVKKKLTYIAMLHKFKQNSILKRLLLSTNNRQLVCTDGGTPVNSLVSVRWSLNVIF